MPIDISVFAGVTNSQKVTYQAQRELIIKTLQLDDPDNAACLKDLTAELVSTYP